MTLSLFVVAGATEDTTPPGEVKLLVSGTLDETTMIATYTISLDASGSAGVAALQFCLTPDENLTQEGDAQLEDVAHIFQVQDRGDDVSVKGNFDYTLNKGVGKYLAYGGKVAETGGHYISGQQKLMTIKYKLTGNSGTLTVSDFIACKSGSDKLEERYTCTAPATVTVSTGVTVSGTVTSFNSTTDTITVELWKAGAVAAAYTTTTTGNTAAYKFDSVESGSYTMKVSKLNHVTREYEITVGNEAVMQEVKICLKGDVNMDGKVNIGDHQRLFSHLQEIATIEDPYQLLIANVNEDGSINIGDHQRLFSHLQGIKSLFEVGS